jgi:hypothetical protein
MGRPSLLSPKDFTISFSITREEYDQILRDLELIKTMPRFEKIKLSGYCREKILGRLK